MTTGSSIVANSCIRPAGPVKCGGGGVRSMVAASTPGGLAAKPLRSGSARFLAGSRAGEGRTHHVA
jgi:hypothetical protein